MHDLNISSSRGLACRDTCGKLELRPTNLPQSTLFKSINMPPQDTSNSSSQLEQRQNSGSSTNGLPGPVVTNASVLTPARLPKMPKANIASQRQTVVDSLSKHFKLDEKRRPSFPLRSNARSNFSPISGEGLHRTAPRRVVEPADVRLSGHVRKSLLVHDSGGADIEIGVPENLSWVIGTHSGRMWSYARFTDEKLKQMEKAKLTAAWRKRCRQQRKSSLSNWNDPNSDNSPDSPRFHYFGETYRNRRHGWGFITDDKRILYEGQFCHGTVAGRYVAYHEFYVEIGNREKLGTATGVVIAHDCNNFIVPFDGCTASHPLNVISVESLETPLLRERRKHHSASRLSGREYRSVSNRAESRASGESQMAHTIVPRSPSPKIDRSRLPAVKHVVVTRPTLQRAATFPETIFKDIPSKSPVSKVLDRRQLNASPDLSKASFFRAADCSQWTTNQLGWFLKTIGLADESHHFRREKLTGSDIIRISDGYLMRIGCTDLTSRKFILCVFRYLWSCLDKADPLIPFNFRRASRSKSKIPKLPRHAIRIRARIGGGGYGSVYLCSLDGGSSERMQAAIKVFSWRGSVELQERPINCVDSAFSSESVTTEGVTDRQPKEETTTSGRLGESLWQGGWLGRWMKRSIAFSRSSVSSIDKTRTSANSLQTEMSKSPTCLRCGSEENLQSHCVTVDTTSPNSTSSNLSKSFQKLPSLGSDSSTMTATASQNSVAMDRGGPNEILGDDLQGLAKDNANSQKRYEHAHCSHSRPNYFLIHRLSGKPNNSATNQFPEERKPPLPRPAPISETPSSVRSDSTSQSSPLSRVPTIKLNSLTLRLDRSAVPDELVVEGRCLTDQLFPLPGESPKNIQSDAAILNNPEVDISTCRRIEAEQTNDEVGAATRLENVFPIQPTGLWGLVRTTSRTFLRGSESQQPKSLSERDYSNGSTDLNYFRRLPSAIKHRDYEAQILGYVQSHPNIIKAHGTVRVNRRAVGLVLEYCDKGSLDSHIFVPRHKLASERLSRPKILKYFGDTARGMAYIHKLGVLHRDLKLSNILIGSDDVAKVADFGISTVVFPTDAPSCVAFYGNVFYAAPEVLRGDGFFFSSDVWSFGVAFWEALTGKFAYEGMTAGEVSTRVASAELTLPIPQDFPHPLRRLLANTLHFDHTQRPDFENISFNLDAIRQEYTESVTTAIEQFWDIA